jgi:membrane protease YdiL (CAAX protease family)
MPGTFLFTTLLPCLLSGILIWAWPRKWSDKPISPSPDESKPQARSALLVVGATLALTTFFIAIFSGGFNASRQREYSLADVIGQAVVWALVLLPLYFGAKNDRVGWHDLQYRRSHLFSAFAMGTLVGGIFLVSAGAAKNLAVVLTKSGLFAAMQYLIVGFAEETLFRGYVQVRWVAALGWWPGFLLASAVMSLFHLPILLLAEHLTLLNALVEVIKIMPLSLLLGYSLQKNGNIVAPAFIHLWLNLIQVL